jgi:hypothetical protein
MMNRQVFPLGIGTKAWERYKLALAPRGRLIGKPDRLASNDRRFEFALLSQLEMRAVITVPSSSG